MPVDLENSSTASGEASVSSTGNQNAPPKSTNKKKRSLPGTPDPDAEVIALSPKTLLATNRFVCEICNKGFQRDQNLQLHRRGHNLPWKLRQRSNKEVKKRVYVCPEKSCVHHDPTRALGDLTGIKKHFCRKHGEKKWKCDKCSKKYAVQSDYKAHSKVCGTKEYKCDCGAVFSRRDSFITHRAFCDMLTKESAKVQSEEPNLIEGMVKPNTESDPKVQPVDSSTSTPPTAVLAPALTNLFASSTASATLQPSQTPVLTDLMRAMAPPERPTDVGSSSSTDPIALCLSTNPGSSIFGSGGQEPRQYSQPAMSATALLQKAAQMGAAASNATLLRGFGIVSSSSSASAHEDSVRWSERSFESDNVSLPGLGLGLPCEGSSGLKELMMGTPSVFGPNKPTLDFLGLGMAAGGATPGVGRSALVPPAGGALDVAARAASLGGGGGGGGEIAGKDIGTSS
ncbi:zinc finger protein ENHYDROUS [Citrus sinensis]|nr:zinc finger protein ENHYDROUS [Citrus sinensis]